MLTPVPPANSEGGHQAMPAELVYRTKETFGQGLIDIVIWRLPDPVPPSRHRFKYRLVYVVDGKRQVGYDNKRGKGDHKHLGDREIPYRWVNPQRLMTDFLSDIGDLLV